MNPKIVDTLYKDKYNLIDADVKYGDDYYLYKFDKKQVFDLLKSIVDVLEKG